MKWEFSKIVLAIIVFVYFGVTAVLCFVVVTAHDHAAELVDLVKAPTLTAIGFYAWKAKCENVLKIPRKDREQVVKLADKKEGDDDNAVG